MTTSARTKAIAAIVAIVAFLVMLVLLSGTLDQLTFRPGQPLPRERAATEEELETHASPPASTGEAIGRVIGIVTLATVLGAGLLAIISRDFRRAALMYITSACTFGAFLLVGMRFLGRLFGSSSSDASGAEFAPLDVPDATGVQAPSWVLALLVAVLGIAAIAAIAYAVTHLRRWWLERQSQDEPLQDLVEQVAQAADRIRTGGDLRNAVIRCYQDMQEILSRRRGLRPTYMTPREFAASLREVGMSDEHIDRLTSLFELVRYGNRADDEYASEALACLDAIQTAHQRSAEPT